MGNAAVKLSITLDHEQLRHEIRQPGQKMAAPAGKDMTGKVILIVHKRVSFQPVILVVQGKEIVTTRISKQTTTHDRSLMRSEAMLGVDHEHPGGTMTRGRYVLPFKVFIPSVMPTTMQYGDPRRQGCKIEYRVMAALGNITVDRAFAVAATPIEDTKVPCFIEPKTERINSMGLLKVGTVTFGACVNDTKIGRGQIMDVSVACKNNSTVDIRSVHVLLSEIVTFTSSKSFEHKIRLLELKDVDLPGLVKGKSSKDVVKQNSEVSTHGANFGEIFQALVSSENTLRIRIPERARDSNIGAIIKIQHFLKIKILTGVFADNLDVKIPVFIGRPPLLQEQSVQHHATVPLADIPATAPPSTAVPVSGQQVSLPDPVPSTAPSQPDSNAIPFATATPVPSDTSDAPIATMEYPVVQAQAVAMGGMTTVSQHGREGDESIDISDTIIPLAPPILTTPSLDQLLRDMVASVNDFDILADRLTRPEWEFVFEELQPSDYGSIVAHVNNDHDQPRIAELVAPRIRQFGCVYAIAALKNTADWNRTSVVSKLVPLCHDLQTNRQVILNELTHWERTVTASDFEAALQ